MRNPNGYGSVVKLSGNRRRPYAARKTKGWDDRGYPIYTVIGYYPTREEAMIALAEYNKNPYDVDASKITVAELYEKWLDQRAPKLAEKTQSIFRSTFRQHFKAVSGMRYRDLRAHHMQDVIDHCGRGYSTQGAIKALFGHLDGYAYELDVIDKRYSDLITSAPVEETTRRPFTHEEIAALWSIRDEPGVDSILILLYTGWRISELLGMKKSDVDLEEWTMRGGLKTASGKNRLVPIHEKIRPLVLARMAGESEMLFPNAHGGRINESNHNRNTMQPIMQRLGQTHTAHECRHTLRTELDAQGGNKRCIDLIMGHKSADVGERVYTHKAIDDLRATIKLVSY